MCVSTSQDSVRREFFGIWEIGVKGRGQVEVLILIKGVSACAERRLRGRGGNVSQN